MRKNKEVASAHVGNRRRDIFRYRIGMKLFIGHDPHVDLLLAHQREQHGVESFLEPTLTQRLLFTHGEEFRQRRNTLSCLRTDWRRQQQKKYQKAARLVSFL